MNNEDYLKQIIKEAVIEALNEAVNNTNKKSFYEKSFLNGDEIKITRRFNYINNGTNNCCVNIEGYREPFRARSEMLILKDGKIYLAKIQNKFNEVFRRNYSVSGGSWEPKEKPQDAAIRETQEELMVNVKNVSYVGNFLVLGVAKWVKDNIPKDKQWCGYYNELFIGEYDGKYNGKVDEEDKEIKMKNAAKFYDIDKIYNDLCPEHQYAIDTYILNQ